MGNLVIKLLCEAFDFQHILAGQEMLQNESNFKIVCNVFEDCIHTIVQYQSCEPALRKHRLITKFLTKFQLTGSVLM